MPRLLLVEDEPAIADTLVYVLQGDCHQVNHALTGADGLAMQEAESHDLAILDVGLPDMTGFDLCRKLRERWPIPVLFLTARDGELDRVLGLELGADDYIVKPFSFRELLARIRANLRRVSFQTEQSSAQTSGSVVHIGSIEIDKRRYAVTRQGAAVSLSQREYDLLVALQEADGAVIKRGDLLDQVWGDEWIGDPRTLDVHMRWLREKLEEEPGAPRLLLTVRGVGYRLVSGDEL